MFHQLVLGANPVLDLLVLQLVAPGVMAMACMHMQAVGPVAVTSLLLGSGLKDLISSDVQAEPNNPKDPAAQMEYNMAAIQVCCPPAPQPPPLQPYVSCMRALLAYPPHMSFHCLIVSLSHVYFSSSLLVIVYCYHLPRTAECSWCNGCGMYLVHVHASQIFVAFAASLSGEFWIWK